MTATSFFEACAYSFAPLRPSRSPTSLTLTRRSPTHAGRTLSRKLQTKNSRTILHIPRKLYTIRLAPLVWHPAQMAVSAILDSRCTACAGSELLTPACFLPSCRGTRYDTPFPTHLRNDTDVLCRAQAGPVIAIAEKAADMIKEDLAVGKA